MTDDSMPDPAPTTRDAGTAVAFTVNGEPVEIAGSQAAAATLLDVLRDELGHREVKDGCAPQGQCGCCTVLVDGAPRVACVTPVRRVAGRSVTTVSGLADGDAWAESFCATGATQCGFCTPGIITRLAGLAERRPDADHGDVEQALLAHLCRCTGWRTILDAWDHRRDGTIPGCDGDRDLAAASERARLESGGPQRVDPAVALGSGGFADDLAPGGARLAALDADGAWVVADDVAALRAASGKVQGRRTTAATGPPVAVPDDGPARADDVVLATSWVDPAPLEPDASWAEPGSPATSPLANGGAFGAKVASPVPAVAEALAVEHGTPVRVRFSREDSVRLGTKRPPLAAVVHADGTGVVRVAATPGIAEAIHAVLPEVRVEEVEVAGPPTSADLRGAGRAEATILAAGIGAVTVDDDGWVGPVPGRAGGAAWARATVGPDARLEVRVDAGDPLDAIVLRSYAIGAAHQALSWVTSESLSVDADGTVHDLTIRSFGITRAADTPPIDVEIVADAGPPAPIGDAVFAATAAAVWLAQGRPATLPSGRGLRSLDEATGAGT